MSAKPVLVQMPKKGPKKKASPSSKKPEIVLPRPSQALRNALRHAAELALNEQLSYRRSQDLFRVFLQDRALFLEKGNNTKAGQRLGISRDHLRDFHARGIEALKP